MRPLAVTSMQRSKKYPDLPTMDEAGLKGYEVNTWMGFFGPANMPKNVVTAIETAIKEAVAMPDVRARFETTGAVVRSGTADEMRQLLATDVAKWAKLVKEKNIKLAP
jgi:tripartite-type tricarboxylate transporter receptor subunit TctC